MPFLKFSRDRRGYEHFYLVQPSNRGKSRPRVLYWFRTPPNIKVGRTPFDPDMRRVLEAQNPDVTFDWEAIIRALNYIGYEGALSVDWKDAGMQRDYGAEDACRFVKRLDFDKSPPPDNEMFQ